MNRHSQRNRSMERGQATILVVLALSIFLVAFLGWATDYTNFWFHRQATQGGADATCQAAAVDLFLLANGVQSPKMNFNPVVGGSVDCSTATPTPAPCVIASYNGYNATVGSNHVVMSFPAEVDGVTPPPGVDLAFVKVDVTKDVPAYFSRVLTGRNTVPVHAAAVCGLTSVLGPVPLIVLHPSDPSTILMDGGPSTIEIVGGPKQSVQVNSADPGAVTTRSLSTVDLSQGGPDRTGSSFGTFGGQPDKPDSVNLGTTGHWQYPHLPISDPYAKIPYPDPKPPTPGNSPFTVQLGEDGCPDPDGCDEFKPGSYDGGICVKSGNGCPGGGGATHGPHTTAIFQPGVYYLGGVGLKLAAPMSTVRVTCCGGRADGDLTGGVMFYFSGDSGTSVYIDSNSGSAPTCAANGKPNGCVALYHVDGSSETVKGKSVASRALQCPGGKAPPPGVPSTITGNVFLAPCTGTYGDPKGDYRGFLYFQDRAIAVGTGGGTPPPRWQGGGSTLAAGFMYFHQCRAGDHTGDGTCTAFGDRFNMGGTPGSGSYAVGSLITDKIHQNGNPNLKMILYPDNTFGEIRIGFFQ